MNSVLKKPEAKPKSVTYTFNIYTVYNILSCRNYLILDIFYIIYSIFYKILHLYYNYLDTSYWLVENPYPLIQNTEEEL